MTPAALAALLVGDTENFKAAATPGGIEAQERAGQIRDSLRETLPKQMRNCTRETFEALGFKFTGETEKIFWTCEFPPGWRKQPTEHAMWSKLLDAKGRRRGMIFFKAAFYDFNAHVRLEQRYQIHHAEPCDANVYEVRDEATGQTLQSFKASDTDRWREEAHAQAMQWLNEHFPDWRNPLAYWD